MKFFILKTPYEVSIKISEKAKAAHKYMKLTQQLSDKSGASLGSLKRFERTGEISLSSLLKIALVLDSLKEFERLFDKPEYTSIEEILNDKTDRIDVYIGERHVGTLAETKHCAAFQYSNEWISNGFSISPFSLPLEKTG